MKFGLAGLAAIAMLAAAPLSLAQQSTAPTAPPAVNRPAPVPPTTAPTPPSATTPAMPPSATTPANPASPADPASPPAMTPAPSGEGDASDDPARTCRTFRDVSQQCSCRSAPTEMGTAVAPTDGGTRNLCVVPRQ